MKEKFYILIAFVTVFELLADFLFKKWVLVNSKLFLLVGIGAYLVSTILWAFSLKYETLSKGVVVFSVLSLIAIVLMGVFVFGEELSNVNILGIILGVASIVLVSL